MIYNNIEAFLFVITETILKHLHDSGFLDYMSQERFAKTVTSLITFIVRVSGRHILIGFVGHQNPIRKVTIVLFEATNVVSHSGFSFFSD